jgi:hypothetical protein
MAKKAASKTAKPKSTRTKWLDTKDTPLLKQYAQEMQSFVKAMADGVVEPKELEQQEKDIVALMKEIEPKLDDELHEKVTKLLCEITVYDMMQMAMALRESRPASKFKG